MIPAATGLKNYRRVEIAPSEDVPVEAYTRPPTEEQLLAALEEISDGDGADLGILGLGFAEDGDGNGTGRDSLEAEEVPEVDSQLDEES